MSPPLPRFFLRMQRGVTWQRSCKNWGRGPGRGGRFSTLPSTKAPSSGLSATFSPRGGEGLSVALRGTVDPVYSFQQIGHLAIAHCHYCHTESTPVAG
jgi:hypothetical protein